MKQRNSPERALMLAQRRHDQDHRLGGGKVVVEWSGKRRRSTHGFAGETWRTKKWTEARRPAWAKN